MIRLTSFRPLSAKAFTLLELLVVLMIVSLATAFVVPQLAGSLSKMNARTAAKKTASALRYARSRATVEKRIYKATIDFEENTLVIRPADTPQKTGDAENSGGKQAKQYRLPEGVRFLEAVSVSDEVASSGLVVFSFYPSGGSCGGEITLTDEKERRFIVYVDMITGTVRLADEK